MMLMFSIFLVMAVIMCSYYFDMGDRYAELTQQVGDRIWCGLDMPIIYMKEDDIKHFFGDRRNC
ncbi:MAG: hypothetical protein SOZ48_05265 [Eubacterium sp.]|nr:hypothetical protein [Eubacterium sp.]